MQRSEADRSVRGVSETQRLVLNTNAVMHRVRARTEVYSSSLSSCKQHKAATSERFTLPAKRVIRPVMQQRSPQVENDEHMTRQKCNL